MSEKQICVSEFVRIKEFEPWIDAFNLRLFKSEAIKRVFKTESENYNSYSYKEKILLFEDISCHLLRISDLIDRYSEEFCKNDFERTFLDTYFEWKKIIQEDIEYYKKYDDTDEHKADKWLAHRVHTGILLNYNANFQMRSAHEFEAIKDGLTKDQWLSKWTKRGENIYYLAKEKGINLVSKIVQLDDYRKGLPQVFQDEENNLDISEQGSPPEDLNWNKIFTQCRLWSVSGRSDYNHTDIEMEGILNDDKELEEFISDYRIEPHTRQQLAHYY